MTALDARQRLALEQAANWYSTLQNEEVTATEQRGWEAWLQDSAENRWAWEHAQGLQQRLRGLPATLTGRALNLADQAGHSGRRTLLKGFVLAFGTGVLGYGGYRQASTAGWMADYQTSTGEQKKVVLADGSQLHINTDSAVDVRYNAGQRRLTLHKGEILISTAPDPAGRPFFVDTAQGRIQALGTRFSVRREDGVSSVAVFEHQVRISPIAGTPLILDAASQCTFQAHHVGPPEPVTSGQDAWTRGVLVANDQRLDTFLAQLGRYRAGWLRCDPAVASLRISGAFAVQDTDQALQALTTNLPVRLERTTRYWVTVLAR